MFFFTTDYFIISSCSKIQDVLTHKHTYTHIPTDTQAALRQTAESNELIKNRKCNSILQDYTIYTHRPLQLLPGSLLLMHFM